MRPSGEPGSAGHATDAATCQVRADDLERMPRYGASDSHFAGYSQNYRTGGSPDRVEGPAGP
jgi:hypothetical protein